MAANKIIFGNSTLIDLTADTVTPDKLISGYTAHSANGNKITGTAKNWVVPINPSTTPTEEGACWIVTS